MNNRYATLFAILKKKGITEEKDRKDLVLAFSGGKTDSLKELSNFELIQLERSINSQKTIKSPADLMRKKIIGLLCTLNGYTSKSGKVYQFVNGEGKPNMTDIYEFILKNGYLKKRFTDYSQTELVKLVTQVDNIRKNITVALAEESVKELKEELGV